VGEQRQSYSLSTLPGRGSLEYTLGLK